MRQQVTQLTVRVLKTVNKTAKEATQKTVDMPETMMNTAARETTRLTVIMLETVDKAAKEATQLTVNMLETTADSAATIDSTSDTTVVGVANSLLTGRERRIVQSKILISAE